MTYSVVGGQQWIERARVLKDEGWDFIDLTALDRLSIEANGASEAERFEVVVQLRHQQRKEHQTIHIAATGDPPAVPSIVEVWPGADFFEREVFDLFGVRFDGHPNLVRIMLPDEWEGHPLRKDYGVGKVTVEYLPQPYLQLDTPGQGTSPDESAAKVDRLGQLGPPERHHR
ncbi:MAG: NADH-quinone oxidoreductase subunit C [Actinomycetota bacterium]|nr:NADH-quinone oxidoreductase subunit C [Actinomycetota bacterium]